MKLSTNKNFLELGICLFLITTLLTLSWKVLDNGVADAGLWLVNVLDGSHQQINIPLAAPESLLAATFSPDGSKIVYATSKGMGFGSEIWLANANGSEAQRLLQDELTIISNLIWSPNGQKMAFTKIADSPVPFSGAGLWVMNSDGSNVQFLTVMDGGRGQEPIWSRDSQKLYFVARENYDNTEADYETKKLVSSIQAVDATTGQVTALVQAKGARQLDLTLTKKGDLLFVSNRTSTAGRQERSNSDSPLEVWQLTPTGQLQQLTNDGEGKRHPVLIENINESHHYYLPLIVK